MQRILLILLISSCCTTNTFSQKDSANSLKFKRWEFGVGAGITFNPRPFENTIVNSSSKMGGIIDIGASYYITKWLIAKSGIGFYTGAFSCDFSYPYQIPDTMGATPLFGIAKKTRTVSYNKLYLPLNVYLKVFEKKKHIVKLGGGFHKEIIFLRRLDEDNYINGISSHHDLPYNNSLKRFFILEKGDFAYRFSLEYAYKVSKKLQMVVGYFFYTNFKKIGADSLKGGSFNSICVGITI